MQARASAAPEDMRAGNYMQGQCLICVLSYACSTLGEDVAQDKHSHKMHTLSTTGLLCKCAVIRIPSNVKPSGSCTSGVSTLLPGATKGTSIASKAPPTSTCTRTYVYIDCLGLLQQNACPHWQKKGPTCTRLVGAAPGVPVALERSLLSLAWTRRLLVKAQRGRLDKYTLVECRNSVWVVPVRMSTNEECTKHTPPTQADQI